MFKHLSAITFCAVAMAAPQFVLAQSQQAKLCGASHAMEELIRQDPSYGRHLAEMDSRNQALTQGASQRQMLVTDKVIPVVIHILHDNGTFISRDQALDAIRILNEDFNRAAADTGEVINAFKPIAADAQITFRLAQIDPDGNCTDGITRTYTPLTNSADNAVKDLVRWNPSKYLNVWVVNDIASGAGGYSYRPCVSPLIDGVVVLHTQFGGIGTSSGNGLSARTITHEVGHYLNLPHTWGGTNDPGVASNCTIDDGIADTPNTVGVSNQSCNTGMTSCGGILANVQNFMDYADCPKMFTEGQKTVMHDALENLSCRQTLWSAANLIATGTNDGYVSTICAPIVDFSADKMRICEGTAVAFSDRTFNAEVDTATWSWLWSFPGGTPSTSTDQNVIVTYNTPGKHNVTLTVTNPGGTNTKTVNEYIHVIATDDILQAPVTESFENSSFPLNPSDPNKNWELWNATTTSWERTSSAAYDGNSSMRIRHSYIATDRKNSLITPNIDVSGITQPVVRFSYAYTKSSASAPADELRVYYSIDCGNNWSLRMSKAGNALVTTTNYEPFFVPTTTPVNEWAEAQVSLPATGLSTIMLKFESTSKLGNTLYIDAVRVESNLVGIEDATATHKHLEVIPNPSNGNATVSYDLTKAGKTRLTITNAVGQEVYSVEKSQSAGSYAANLQDLTGKLTAGMYIIRLQSEGNVSVQKLVVE